MLKVDDPVLLREEIKQLKNKVATLTEEVTQLREMLRPADWEPPVEIGLTPYEARIVAALYKHKTEVVSKEKLFYACYHDKHEQPEIKIIDVFVCKLRKKLTDYGIEVKTVHGRGYYLDSSSCAILAEWGIDPRETIELDQAA